MFLSPLGHSKGVFHLQDFSIPYVTGADRNLATSSPNQDVLELPQHKFSTSFFLELQPKENVKPPSRPKSHYNLFRLSIGALTWPRYSNGKVPVEVIVGTPKLMFSTKKEIKSKKLILMELKSGQMGLRIK